MGAAPTWTPKIGDKCEVYSRSNGKWFAGFIKGRGYEIVNEETREERRTLTVCYKVLGATEIFTKKVFTDDRSVVRPLIPGEREEYCLCSALLVYTIANPATDEHNACMMCATELKSGAVYFQCPKGSTKIHSKGYVRCWDCIVDETKLYPTYMTQEMVSKESSDRSPVDMLGDSPFAEGSTCLVYLGMYTIPSKKGRACVIKKKKRMHPYSDEEWKADMLCVEKARELVTAWNEAGIVTGKPFELLTPLMGTRGRGRGSAVPALLQLAILKHLVDGGIEDEDEKMHMLALLLALGTVGFDDDDDDGDDDAAGDEEIALGECVVYEDFLVGHFDKWNSNGGWCSERTARLSVQAFCHWTFHYSKGQCLFCDAQGVRREDRYQITDPAICSTVEAQYGDTDLGPNGMYAWFLTHRCGDYCKTEWLKPTQAQLESVPAEYRTFSAAPGTRSVLTDFASRRVATRTLHALGRVPQTETEETKEETKED